MIFGQFKLIAGAAAIAAMIGAGTWLYFEGKETAREECRERQAKVMKLWQEEIDTANEKNQELAKDLAAKIHELEKAKSVRTKRIIEYVKDDPDSDTVIFDADGLSILNSAQKGGSTTSK